MQQNARIVEIKRDNAEARRRLESQLEALRLENAKLKEAEEEDKEVLLDLADENKKGLYLLDTMKRETDNLQRKTREL